MSNNYKLKQNAFLCPFNFLPQKKICGVIFLNTIYVEIRKKHDGEWYACDLDKNSRLLIEGSSDFKQSVVGLGQEADPCVYLVSSVRHPL